MHLAKVKTETKHQLRNADGKTRADTARFKSRSVARLASSLWLVALFLGSFHSPLLSAGLLGWVEAPKAARVTLGDGEEIQE